MPSHQEYAAALHSVGFSPANASRKAATFVQCDAGLDAMQARADGRVSAWAPGRIELFGKHTDYAGGRSLLTAVERGFCVRAAPRDDQRIRVTDPAAGIACEMTFNDTDAALRGHWSNYVATVVRRIALNFPTARTGVDIAFVSDLPLAAGVSSSTALMIGIFLAVAAVNRLDETEAWKESLPGLPELAGYLGAMEMGGPFGALAGLPGVGILGGSQDQTAILCSQPAHVVDFAWMPVRHVGTYGLAPAYRFVIASSGVVAEKSGAARDEYNRASLMVRHLVASWNGSTGREDRSLAAAMESDAGAPDRLRNMIDTIATETFSASSLRLRLDQFLLETYTLIPAAARAFEAQDWIALGEVTARSQRAAEEWLGNQIPETVALVRLAREHGAIAASAFGAGFGGSVWALVGSEGADAFRTAWAESYRREFEVASTTAMFFTTAAGPAAQQWADAPGGPSLLHRG
ncbi:MAG TPA: galactokinase family protein [Gemmatimonadaceae bacterium]|nr:galactokinase family protein [Gemmatimonadaceae bacterium]